MRRSFSKLAPQLGNAATYVGCRSRTNQEAVARREWTGVGVVAINQSRTRSEKGPEEEDDGWGAVVCAGAGAAGSRRGDLSAHGNSLDPSLSLPAAAALLSKKRRGAPSPGPGSPHSTPPHPMCVRACRGRVLCLCVTVGPGRRAGAGGWCL
jgi:hypothetical protein